MGDTPSKEDVHEAFENTANGDETIDRDQFRNMCYMLYLAPTEDGIDDLFETIDVTEDGRLSIEEVSLLIERQWTPFEDRKISFLEDLRRCRLKSGPIDQDELKQILQRGSNGGLSDKDVKYIFKKLDLNNDKLITDEEITECIFRRERRGYTPEVDPSEFVGDDTQQEEDGTNEGGQEEQDEHQEEQDEQTEEIQEENADIQEEFGENQEEQSGENQEAEEIQEENLEQGTQETENQENEDAQETVVDEQTEEQAEENKDNEQENETEQSENVETEEQTEQESENVDEQTEENKEEQQEEQTEQENVEEQTEQNTEEQQEETVQQETVQEETNTNDDLAE